MVVPEVTLSRRALCARQSQRLLLADEVVEPVWFTCAGIPMPEGGYVGLIRGSEGPEYLSWTWLWSDLGSVIVLALPRLP